MILTEIETGIPKKYAAQTAGVTERTLYNWLRRGAQDQNEGTASALAEFFQSFQKAEARGVQELIRELRSAAPGSWQRYAWLLERMHPADFGAASARKVIDDGYSAGDSPLDRLASQVEGLRRERAEAVAKPARAPRKKPGPA